LTAKGGQKMTKSTKKTYRNSICFKQKVVEEIRTGLRLLRLRRLDRGGEKNQVQTLTDYSHTMQTALDEMFVHTTAYNDLMNGFAMEYIFLRIE
jgi:hypothetical protein